jgi:hypothetical protein
LARCRRRPAPARRALDRVVALAGGRLVVLVGEDRVHAERGGEARDRVARAVVAHDEVAAPGAQPGLQLGHAAVDEFHPPVGARRERIEDFAVEDEGAVDAPGRAQRVVEPGVVVAAQVAAEPEKRGVVRLHGSGSTVWLAVGGKARIRDGR